MTHTRFVVRAVLAALLLVGLTTCGTQSPAPAPKAGAFVFGMILIGPYNDHGWSESHYTAGKYLEGKIPGGRMVYIDNVNPGAKPGVTVPQLVDDMVAQGARIVFTTSDDFKDGTLEAARRHPDLPLVNVSGDHAWKQGRDYQAPPNLSNIMGRMEYGEMMAGYVAALTTRTGKIGYLGPLINDETRRLVVATYLGARHAWVNVLRRDPKDLRFKVSWIGFWFHIPGQTLDPTQVADDFYNNGYDVVVSGIDTTEAQVEAGKMRQSGRMCWAVPYDHRGSFREAPEACLGSPYFNWGPAYLRAIRKVQSGNWTQFWEWNGPDWSNIDNPDTGAIGFQKGPALAPEAAAKLDEFVKGLGGGSLELFRGPLRFQDGAVYLKPGETATDAQVWYLPQLLAGMEGPSK
jgi:simple sugar transport system substrate-binding protein